MASDQGDRIHLAGYDLTLPRAYAVATDRCLPELAGPYVPVGSSEFFAKSAAGGCLEVVMVPGSAKPRDAVPVAIGRRQGFVATTADLIMLYVPLPTSDYRFLLLMSDRSTSQEQLISIANGGLKFD